MVIPKLDMAGRIGSAVTVAAVLFNLCLFTDRYLTMLMLLFYVGNDLYALDSAQVVEIIPRVMLRKIHHAPDYVAGLFNYRGTIVPVIDLCHLIQGTPSLSHLSTRIIMVKYVGKDNAQHCLGLMAERVTETLNKPDKELVDSGIQMDDAPYLGGMIMDEKGMIQRIRLEYLLSDSQQKYLLPAKEKAQITTQENATENN